MKCIIFIVSQLSLLALLQGELCLQNYCSDGVSVDPPSLSSGQEFTVTTPRQVQKVAIFNATHNFCGREDFDNGYRCIVLSVNCTNAACVQQVRCKDNADKLKNLLSYALLNLTLSFGQPDEKIDINENENENDENESNENENDENESNENENDENESNENENDENESIENENNENGSNENDENESNENENDENESNENENDENESNENESNENGMDEDGNDINGECYGSIQIFWNQVECVVEEFHEPLDPCSGILDDSPNFGTNTTLFTVNLNGIESIGSAVLLSANSYFCGRETLNGNTSDVILCEAEVHTSNASAADTKTGGYFAHFQCPGDATLIPEGPATIVFERNLTSNLSAGCQALTPSVPFVSYYSGFQIYWRHSDFSPNNTCERVTAANLGNCSAVCISQANYSTEAIEICEQVVNSILDGDDLTADNFSTVLDILDALTMTPGVEYLEVSLQITEDLVTTLQENPLVVTDGSAKRLIGVFDAVLADEKQHEWILLQEENNLGPRLLQSLEETESLLSMALALDGEPFQYTGESITVLTVERVQLQDFLLGSYRFPKVGDISTMMEIPIQLLCEDHTYSSKEAAPDNLDCPSVISSAVIHNLPGYLDQTITSREFKANTVILTATVQNAPHLEEQITTHPVQLHFAPTEIVYNFSNSSMCVFWNFSTSNWSSVGINTTLENRRSATCTTTHLTSFAVLVDVNGPQITTREEKLSLQIVTYIGCCVSLICLLLTIFTFMIFGKYLNKGVLLPIHLNFSIALALALLLFISGLETTRNIQWLCTTVAVLLHYFFLCVFCWMLVEGIMLYLLVVRVFGKGARKWYYFLILGWGLPIAVVGLSVGVRHQDYGTDDFCWLSTRSGTIWAFVGPMLFIILINTIVLVLTIVSLVRAKKLGGAEPHVKNVQLVKTAVKSTVILLPLLGITWVFGLLAVNENTTVFAWLFTVCNSLQGFFIFVFHVLRNEKVRETLRCFKCFVPVAGMERKDSIKDISNRTSELADGVEAMENNQDQQNVTTEYCLRTFERSYSGTSQDSVAGFVNALNTI